MLERLPFTAEAWVRFIVVSSLSCCKGLSPVFRSRKREQRSTLHFEVETVDEKNHFVNLSLLKCNVYLTFKIFFIYYFLFFLQELHPPFCVHSAGPEDRLPSASTCMNLLKLPEYLDDETMKEKLLYAVESGAGFELS